MDAKATLCLCIVSGAALGGLIGATFGGITAMLTTLHGRAAGSMLGRSVIEAFARVSNQGVSAFRGAVLIGAVDGAAFLGLLGAVAGVWLGSSEVLDRRLLAPIAGIALVLPLLAVGFGLTAYTLSWLGVRMVGLICTCSLAAALAGYRLEGTHGILLGALGGTAGGMALACVIRRGLQPASRERPRPE